MRKRNVRDSRSLAKDTLHKLGKKRRLVLFLAWETLFPVIGPLPVNSQTRDIGLLRCSVCRALGPRTEWVKDRSGSDPRPRRQAETALLIGRRLGVGAIQGRKRVFWLQFVPQFKVQLWTIHRPGTADFRDDLALLHFIALAYDN